MPPAEKATTARIGLVGQACAHTSPFAKARARTDSSMKQIRVMPFSLVSRRALRGRSATGQQPVGFRAKDSTHRPGRRLLRCWISIRPMSLVGERAGMSELAPKADAKQGRSRCAMFPIGRIGVASGPVCPMFGWLGLAASRAVAPRIAFRAEEGPARSASHQSNADRRERSVKASNTPDY